MKGWRTAGLVWVLLLGMPRFDAPAQEAGLPFLHNDTIHDYGGEETGAGPQVFCAAQDGAGRLFFGNARGVLSYDGVRFRLVPTDPPGQVLSLETDAAGTVFVGGAKGFGRLVTDAASRTRFEPLSKGLPDEVTDVWQTTCTPEGVYFRTRQRLYRWSSGKLKDWRPKTDFHIGNAVRGVLYQRESGTGMLRMENDELRLIPGGDLLANDRTYVILPFGPGRVLFGTREHGLLVFDEKAGTLTPFPTEADAFLAEGQLYHGAVLANGCLALGTRRSGLVVIDPAGRVVQKLGREQGLVDDQVFQLLVDRAQDLWVAWNRGLSRIEVSSPLTRFGEVSGLPGLVESIVRHEGRLYAATSFGVFRLVPGAPARFEAVPGLHQNVFALASAEGRLLAASEAGVFDVGPDGVTKLIPSFAFSLAPSRVTPGRVWVGLERGLTSVRVRDGRVSPEGKVPGVAEHVFSLAEDDAGRLWIGTAAEGTLRVDPATDVVERFGKEQGLASGFVFPGRVRGELLFGTKQGLYRFDEAAKRFLPDARLGERLTRSAKDLFRIVEGPDASVYLRFGDENLRAVPRAGGGYDVSAGPLRRLPDVVRVNAFLPEPDGVTWVGTDEGLLRWDTKAPFVPDSGFGVSLTPVFGSGGPRPGTDPPTLAYAHNSVRFDVAALSYREPGRNRYETWLEGFEKSPSAPRSEPFREYTNLPEGSLRFHVKARNLFGEEGREAVFALRILPPWYRTPWAYGLDVVLAAAALAAFSRLRERRLRARNAELEKTVTERTLGLSEANRRLEEAQRRIADLMRSAPGAIDDIPSWSRGVAEDLAKAVGVRAIGVYAVEGQEITTLSRTTAVVDANGAAPTLPQLPSLEMLKRAMGGPDAHVVAVRGLTGDLYGGLVVDGEGLSPDGPERRLMEGFAHQLGAALEMRRMKRELEAAQLQRERVRREMTEQGIALVRVCRACGLCHEESALTCVDDGRDLPAPLLLPYRFVDRYRLERQLGEGGMGTVFSARDEKLDREVALKVIRADSWGDPRVRGRFQSEARAVARIAHPGVVALFDQGELGDGSLFLVMERLRGKDLADLFEVYGRGTPRQVARVVRQGASALAAAHRAGLVHRDIKPENVFLVARASAGGVGAASEEPVVKILDFGLAKSTTFDLGLTQAGSVVGTPAYMSPEQVSGRELTPKSDLYSFAVVCHEALTGRRLVTAADLGGVFMAILQVGAPLVSLRVAGAPPEVDAAFAAALAKSPSERPENPEEWGASLAASLEKLESPEAGWPSEYG